MTGCCMPNTPTTQCSLVQRPPEESVLLVAPPLGRRITNKEQAGWPAPCFDPQATVHFGCGWCSQAGQDVRAPPYSVRVAIMADRLGAYGWIFERLMSGQLRRMQALAFTSIPMYADCRSSTNVKDHNMPVSVPQFHSLVDVGHLAGMPRKQSTSRFGGWHIDMQDFKSPHLLHELSPR